MYQENGNCAKQTGFLFFSATSKDTHLQCCWRPNFVRKKASPLLQSIKEQTSYRQSKQNHYNIHIHVEKLIGLAGPLSQWVVVWINLVSFLRNEKIMSITCANVEHWVAYFSHMSCLKLWRFLYVSKFIFMTQQNFFTIAYFKKFAIKLQFWKLYCSIYNLLVSSRIKIELQYNFGQNTITCAWINVPNGNRA